MQKKISEEEYNYEVARAEIGLWTPYSHEVLFTADEADESAPPETSLPAEDFGDEPESTYEESPALEQDME